MAYDTKEKTDEAYIMKQMTDNLEFMLAQLRSGNLIDYFFIGLTKERAYDISGDKGLLMSLVCNNLDIAFDVMIAETKAQKKGLN